MKYQSFTPSGGKNIGIRKSEFVTKTQFLWGFPKIFINTVLWFFKKSDERVGKEKCLFYEKDAKV